MSITRCTVIGHKWQPRRYPAVPPQDEHATFAECLRCGKQRDVDINPGMFKYTAGGSF